VGVACETHAERAESPPHPMSRPAMPPAWLRMSGGHPHLLILPIKGRGVLKEDL
jgi:hypothetical protein